MFIRGRGWSPIFPFFGRWVCVLFVVKAYMLVRLSQGYPPPHTHTQAYFVCVFIGEGLETKKKENWLGTSSPML